MMVVKNRRRAFTLVELLVVISIIAILLAILMPSLAKARAQASSVACKSNLKQLSFALSMYHEGNNNKGIESAGEGEFWFLQIAPYLGQKGYAKDPKAHLEGAMRVLFCPSTREPLNNSGYSVGTAKNRWRYHVTGYEGEGSYALNTWVGGWDLTSSGYLPPPLIPLYSYRGSILGKADIPSFCDAIWVDFVPLDTDTPPDNTYSGGYRDKGGDKLGIPRIYLDRHNNRINMAFLDNHVGGGSLTELWNFQWNKKFKKTAYTPMR